MKRFLVERRRLILALVLPNRHVLRVGPSSDRPELTSIAPDHMGLVIRPESMPVWKAIVAWIDRLLAT